MIFFSKLFGKGRDKTIPKLPYKVGKYKVTKHCVDDMNKRKITKGEVHINLSSKPIQVTKVKYDDF